MSSLCATFFVVRVCACVHLHVYWFGSMFTVFAAVMEGNLGGKICL